MSDDLFAIYGTEFEELEEDEVASSQKPAAVQDQIVTDERGRRRFHGAFSGGFSAGYFNTVGSKEGWKPQEFRSSRDQRALQNQQRPEDIMDEEDLGEFGVGGRRIRQSATFGSRGATDGGAGGTKRRLAWEHTGEESSNMAQQLEKMIRPVSDSIGVRMLRGMGWREGRGVGLATGKHKHKRSQGDSDDDGSFHKEQMSKLCSGFELSLEDELVQHLRPLSGTHGLGYEGLRQTNVLDQKYGSSASALKLDKKGKGIRGQAFGVGAFEVEDDSVYSNYDLSQYDFAIGGGSRHEKEPEAPSVDSTFEEMPKRLRPRPFFAAPRLPPNFKPEHKPIAMPSEKLPTGVQNAFKAVPISQRSRLLGEDRFSVMELLKDGDRKRLAQAKSSGSRWNRDESNEEGTSEGAHDKDRIAFPDEPMKQKRFKEFLNYLKRGLSYPQPSDMSVWEWEAEKGDFEAKLSCEERSMLPEVRARAKPLAKSALAMPMKELLQNKFTKETGHSGKADRGDEDKLAAVKSGMFGPLTRTTFEWYPDNVLAKRFNVPHPYPGSHLVGVPHLKKVAKTETMLNLGLPNTENELIFRRTAEKQVDSHRRSEHGGDTEGDAPPTVIPEKPIQIEERPPDALFDAIFGPSSSESEDEPEPERPPPSTAKVLPRESPDKESSPTPTPSSRVSQEKGEEEEESDEYGPAPPPSSSQTGLSGFSVLRYLQEELERKKRKKKKSKESHKKHKKVKKEKKSKKGKKSEKKKKKKKSTTASSSSSSSSDSDIEVLS